MANTVIQIKSSGVVGNVPSTLFPGELAINYEDGKLYYGNSASQVELFDVITEPAGLDGEIQFNDSGSFGSDSKLTFDKSEGLLSTTTLKSTQSSGDEGGQLDLSTSQTNNLLSGGTVTIDIYQNKLRFFESGGTYRGVYIDLANGASSGVGTNLLNPAAASYANSAYLHANSAYEYANALSGGTATDGVARNIANSAYIQANASFQNSNSAISSATSAGLYANSAYGQANTATILAQAAFDKANTGITDATDQIARNTANASYNQANTATTNAVTADQRAVTSGDYANSAFIAANNAITYTDNAIANLINSAPTTLDTLNELAAALGDDPNFATTISTMVGVSSAYANSAYIHANASYLQSNTAISSATSAGSYANSAFVQSNTGTILAQAAYDFANTIVSDTQIDPYARNHSNSAYEQANTANLNSITSGVYANNAYLQANTTNSYFLGVSSEQNTTISIVGSYANSAYNQANDATTLAQSVYDYANTISVSESSSIVIGNDVSTNSEYYITFTNKTSGSASLLNTSDEKLSYNPSRGAISVEAIDVSADATISSSSLENTSGNQFLVDSFDALTYRGAFYQVQIQSPGEYQVLNLNIVHNGSAPTVSTFGSASTSSSLGTFTATIIDGVLQLLFTPNVGLVIVSFIRNVIKKIRDLVPAGDLGYIEDTASIVFDAGYVEDSSSVSFDYGELN